MSKNAGFCVTITLKTFLILKKNTFSIFLGVWGVRVVGEGWGGGQGGCE